jgi:hypothetical protein
MFLLRSQSRIWWCKLGDYAPLTLGRVERAHFAARFRSIRSYAHFARRFVFLARQSFISSLVVFSTVFYSDFGGSAWEVLENSNAVIEHYRQNTASLDYFGDSVFNSVGDVFACAAGFLIARQFGFWRSLAFFFATEIVLLVWIRDSLLLNIIMLIYPLESIKAWQIG